MVSLHLVKPASQWRADSDPDRSSSISTGRNYSSLWLLSTCDDSSFAQSFSFLIFSFSLSLTFSFSAALSTFSCTSYQIGINLITLSLYLLSTFFFSTPYVSPWAAVGGGSGDTGAGHLLLSVSLHARSPPHCSGALLPPRPQVQHQEHPFKHSGSHVFVWAGVSAGCQSYWTTGKR